MQEMIETIRVAVSDGATPEEKMAGAQTCRMILAALEAETGKAIALAGVPTPSPLAGVAPEQALDLLIARLSSIVPEETSTETTGPPSRGAPLRIAFVQPPPRPARRRNR